MLSRAVHRRSGWPHCHDQRCTTFVGSNNCGADRNEYRFDDRAEAIYNASAAPNRINRRNETVAAYLSGACRAIRESARCRRIHRRSNASVSNRHGHLPCLQFGLCGFEAGDCRRSRAQAGRGDTGSRQEIRPLNRRHRPRPAPTVLSPERRRRYFGRTTLLTL